ncbi:MAG: hypothetical protein V4568_05445 [Pseudomonadota bacterium]
MNYRVHQKYRLSFTALFLLIFCCLASAETLVVGPNDYLTAVGRAKPGSVIRLSPGIYRGGLQIARLNGTADKPIIVEAADPAHPPRFVARERRNTISIIDASYVVVRNLVLDGGNLRVDAVKAEGFSRYAHHITLEGLQILRHGANQEIVGISTKCPAWDWVIRGNVIGRAGTGMYLGNSDGSAPFFSGLIEGNFIYDSVGYNLQIKHQNARPSVSPSSHVTIIRHNVFSKFGNSSTGGRARPNVLVGHFPKEGKGANDRYAIYANFFYANPVEVLFQGEGNVALYANLFVNPFGDGIHIQPHNDVPKNIWFFHNTMVVKNIGIELAGEKDAYLRAFTANAIFGMQPEASDWQADNLVSPPAAATDFLIDPFSFPGRLNLQPKPTMALKKDLVPAFSESFPDAELDFDGAPYNLRDLGAYAMNVGAPRWRLNLSSKPLKHLSETKLITNGK